MGTISYELQSRVGLSARTPQLFVHIPEEYSSIAARLVQLAIERPTELGETEVCAYHDNIGVKSATNKLAKTHPGIPDSLKLRDIVYLRVCVYENAKRLRSKEQGNSLTAAREAAWELDTTLIHLIEELES